MSETLWKLVRCPNCNCLTPAIMLRLNGRLYVPPQSSLSFDLSGDVTTLRTPFLLAVLVLASVAVAVVLLKMDRDNARASAAELEELRRTTDELERWLHRFDGWDEHVDACERYQRLVTAHGPSRGAALFFGLDPDPDA